MIFVHIAAYRDPEIFPTVQSALARANNPEELVFGIVWQGLAEDEEYIAPLEDHPQVRLIKVDARRSKGACWARSRVWELYEDEEYTLQIDSHHRFAPSWDTKCKFMLHQARRLSGHRRVLLTAYLPGYEPPNRLSDTPPMTLGAVKFDADGLIHLIAREDIGGEKYPQLGIFISAHFLFSYSGLWEEVPYDPELYFFGEEISLSVRAWTSGWDIYYPNQVVAYHKYGRGGRRLHWDDKSEWWREDRVSKDKVRMMLLGGDVSCGLGSRRSLGEWEELSGVDLVRQRLSKESVRGRVMVQNRSTL